MIPRTLIPRNLSPAALERGQPAHRFSTYLDDRHVIPPEMPPGPLEVESNIPAHVPLGVLARRMVIPRDLPPLSPEARAASRHGGLTMLDARVAIPKAVEPGPLETRAPVRPEQFRDVLDPDVLSTGEVHLLARPVEVRPPVMRWQVAVPSALAHAALLLLIGLQPTLFPYDPPSEQEIEHAHRMLGMVYVPPPEQALPLEPVVPQQAPPVAPPPQIRIDPRVFEQYQTQRDIEDPGVPDASREVETPAPPERELPAAPRPQPRDFPAPTERAEAQPERPRQEPRLLEPPGPREGSALTLNTPPVSPGRALEESLRGALENPNSATSGGFSDELPPVPGGGGGGQGYVGQAYQLLTPTQGVDFTNYLARVLASVRRNWYAVIPESARLGEQGMVVLQFRIMQNGEVPYPEPSLVRTSGRQPLDRAAMSSIRASSPFEPLPSAFRGPFIELRFIFLYNMRLER